MDRDEMTAASPTLIYHGWPLPLPCIKQTNKKAQPTNKQNAHPRPRFDVEKGKRTGPSPPQKRPSANLQATNGSNGSPVD